MSGRTSVRNQVYTKSNGWTNKALKPYGKYKKLCGERKFAQRYPDRPFRFLDLPAEIRNQIYCEYLMIGSIELSPTADDDNGNEKAFKYHMNIYKYQTTSRLRLLRVCKQLNFEAAPLFYSENEFRFSSMHGHDILFAFCRTIGKRNTRLLKNIVEHVPWPGEYEGPVHYGNRSAHTNITSWEWNFKGILRSMGLHQKGHLAQKFNVMRTLGQADGGVKKYSLVLPDRFNLEQSQDFFSRNIGTSLLPWFGEKSNVQMAVVRLKSQHVTGQWMSLLAQAAFRDNMAREARARAWQVVEAGYDRLGRYTYKLNLIEVLRVGEAEKA